MLNLTCERETQIAEIAFHSVADLYEQCPATALFELV